MEKAPNKLRLNNGRIELEDGQDSASYLAEFAERMSVTPDTPVCLVTKSDLDELLFYRQFMLSA